jgi:hypothetical protein
LAGGPQSPQPQQPYPYYPPPLPPPNPGTDTTIIVVVVILVLLVSVCSLTVFLNSSSQTTQNVILTCHSARWSSGDFHYGFPSSGKRLLLLNVTLQNQGKEAVSVLWVWFKAEGINGSMYTALGRSEGPDSIAPGGSGAMALVFEVPTTWAPKTLHYVGPALGPKADASIPVPTGH